MTERNFGKAELHWAAERGQYELVVELLKKGANVRSRDEFKETPLHYASENGHLEVVQALIQAGSDPTLLDNSKRTPLACSLQQKRGRWQAVSAFLQQDESDRHEIAVRAASGLPKLEDVWCKSYIDTPCRECGGHFDVEAPVRTISLKKADPATPISDALPSFMVDGACIAIHNRHLGCVPKDCITAVSHVWHSPVSVAHRERVATPEAIQLVFEIPVRILHATATEWGPDVEIWHDYLSTPQWEYATQQKLLLLLPKIFLAASRTLVHMQDMSITVVNKLQNGTTSKIKLEGMIGIITSQWYSRLWTTLEMVRSHVAHMITLEYKIIKTEDLLTGLIDEVFLNVVREYGSTIAAETAACSGLWPVPRHIWLPWKIKPMMYARGRSQMTLGASYEIILDRDCTVHHDLFYALLGLTGHVLPPRFKLEEGDIEACKQVSFLCINAGDYSPLLIQPIPQELEESKDISPRWLKGYRCYGLHTWAIGHEVSPPQYPPEVINGKVTLNLERVGAVCWSCRFAFDFEDTGITRFSAIITHAFAVTGRNIYDFVHTVGTRIYGMDTPEILKRLSTPDHRAILTCVFDWLDEQSYLDRSVKREVEERETMKREAIRELASTMGLSTNVLSEGMNFQDQYNTSPLEYATLGGGTPHNGHLCCLVTAACRGCGKHALFRIGAWADPSSMLGATLYRIPGLQYDLTLKNGTGMVVKDGRILGRMLYGTPACACQEVEVVELE